MKRVGLIVGLAVWIGLTGCSRSRSIIILLPDEYGQVGELQVETSEGAVSVDDAYSTVEAVSGKAPEHLPKTDQDEIGPKFGKALSASPQQRFRFEKHTFYCRKDATSLIPESRELMTWIIRRILATRPLEIYVVGHADRVGTERHNLQLSRHRAAAIQQELVSNGVSAKIIIISFLGETRPKITTPDEVEEPRNRRVELVMKYSKEARNE